MLSSLESHSLDSSQIAAPAGELRAVATVDAAAVDVLRCTRRAHLVGMGGQGMRSLARILREAGWRISGSDTSSESCRDLAAEGLTVVTGHVASNVPSDVDEVIYSGAVGETNPELDTARRRGLPTFSYAEMVGRLVASRDLVAVAGTHGKSTTTAMVAEILCGAGIDPTVICGAEPVCGSEQAFRSSGCYGRGTVAVAEACEYRRNFLHLRPRWAVITGIELDHFDCYQNIDELMEAFERFAGQLSVGGRLLIASDCARSANIARMLDRTVETFGEGESADWQADRLQEHRGRYRFSLKYQGATLGHVRLSVPGLHNVRNALAAAAVSYHAGADARHVVRGLEAFRGIRRRLEWIGERHGIDLWDDYAHHPTEVTATLTTLRQMYPDRRLCVIFQPHQESRTRHLLDPLAESLKDADIIAITTIFRARESADSQPTVTAADLADGVRRWGADVIPDHDLNRIKQRLHETCRPGDVLVTMGAGDIAARCHEYTDWI